jgi:P27 family predicted phage terminase small subunit
MRGRLPKPTTLKLLTGNPGRRPLNKREPKPRTIIPNCPAWLDQPARTEWHRIVPELRALGLITLVDRAALAAYCQSYADFRDAVKRVRAEGATIKTANGNIIANPAVTQKNRALAALKMFIVEFGLSPASRVRIEAPMPQGKRSQWEGLLV